jgi:hypothetical protein
VAVGHLIDDVKVTTVASVATGTSTITSSAIDMGSFDGALFIVRLGSPATNNNIRLSQCDTTGGSYAELEGTLVGNHATDNPLIIDIKRNREQFLKYIVTRGTTSTIDVVTVIQYRGGNFPVSQPSGTQTEKFWHPAEGTA